jgi:hypothetical protein
MPEKLAIRPMKYDMFNAPLSKFDLSTATLAKRPTPYVDSTFAAMGVPVTSFEKAAGSHFRKFAPFGKVQERADGNLMVWGVATQETVDLDNEVCAYATAVPAYERWRDAQMLRTTGAGQEKSLGNIRLQHGTDIGGKATRIEFKDAAKQVWLGSTPLNDDIANDLRKGFYSGYSQGGSYAWRRCVDCLGDMPLQQGMNYCPKCAKTVKVIYGLSKISEVSYVDSPCSGVGFDYVKTDGSKQFVKFLARRTTKPDYAGM